MFRNILKISQNLLLLSYFLPPNLGHVTIFLDKSESDRVFGVSHAVYYVREGVVNMFAMNTNQQVI